MAKIREVSAIEVLDSRGTPTVMCTVALEGGACASTMVPSGASTGSREACELRDNDGTRFQGKSVSTAVKNVNGELADAVRGLDALEQLKVDQAMIDADGTTNKTRLGANALLAVSLATLRAAAEQQGLPLYRWVKDVYEGHTGAAVTPSLPLPMMNILNGGAHAVNSTDIQEFMIAPVGMANFQEALRAGVEVYMQLKTILKKRGLGTNTGDEGGYAPGGLTNLGALEVVAEAVGAAGYKLGEDMLMALDVAASELYDSANGTYKLASEDRVLSSDELSEEYAKFMQQFPIYSIEDPFSEDDWGAWSKFTSQYGNKVNIIGDDLFVTQSRYLERGVKEGAANGILVKLNQVGTVSETFAAVANAQKNAFKTIISHRSGETEDTSIADIAVGSGSGQIKTGAPARGERTAKYNRLLLIEHLTGGELPYAAQRVRMDSAPIPPRQG